MTTRTSFGTLSAPLIRRMKSTKFGNVRRSAGDGLIETTVLSAMAITSRRSRVSFPPVSTIMVSNAARILIRSWLSAG